jgi:hypothetical protein
MMGWMAPVEPASLETPYARRHLRVGWLSLGVFASFGLVLETFHGFKLAAYVDVSHETRRLMWTLAHAHGVLLGIVHVVFALCLRLVPGLGSRHLRLVSLSLVGATLLLPGGFFLGGLVFYGGDPGLGILLVPVGAALLIFALGVVAGSAASAWRPDEVGRPGRKR